MDASVQRASSAAGASQQTGGPSPPRSPLPRSPRLQALIAPAASSMPRQRRCTAAIAALTAVVCLCALAPPAAARDAFSGSLIDAADPLLEDLGLNLEGVAGVKRHLLQLVPNPVIYAPCNAAKHITCRGTAAAKAAGGALLLPTMEPAGCVVRRCKRLPGRSGGWPLGSCSPRLASPHK